jgi:hypothetical protein
MHCIPMHHPVKLSALKSRKIIHIASSYAFVHCIMLSIGSQILRIPQTVLTWLYKKIVPNILSNLALKLDKHSGSSHPSAEFFLWWEDSFSIIHKKNLVFV